MALLQINLEDELSIFIMSLDIEDDIVKTLKSQFLIETLQSSRSETTAISDGGCEYQCAKYSLNLCEDDRDLIMSGCKRLLRESIEKSLPEISKS